MSRLFIAINLPEEAKQELERVKQEIIGSFPEGAGARVGKWVRQKNLHITLLFIGQAPNEKVNEVVELARQAVGEREPFRIKLSRICYGPKAKGIPRLIWAEIEENKALKHLAASLHRQFSMFSNPITKHSFAGHITLCRLRQWAWKRLEPEERPTLQRELGVEFEAGSVEVMESKLRPQGPEYQIVSSIKLL